MRTDLVLRLALPSERVVLESLQRQVSLASEAYREQLLACPEAIALPAALIEAGQVIVAETGHTVLGFAAWLPTHAEAVVLDGLFVLPEHERQGIGRQLVEAVALVAAERNAERLEVIASPEAVGFYLRCSFVETGAAPTRFGPAVTMMRRLRAS